MPMSNVDMTKTNTTCHLKGKLIISLAAILLFSECVTAQPYIGLKAAYTTSTMAFKPAAETKLLAGSGLDYGLEFKYFNAKYVGFQTELYLTSRGYLKAIDVEELGDTLFKRVNSYLELPMFIQFRLKLGIVLLHVNVGPYFAYLLSAQEGDNSTGKYELSKVHINILRENRFDYGLMGGVGLSHDFRWGTIQAEARFGYGLGDLYDYSYSGMPSESTAIIQNFSLGYLYRFGQGKPMQQVAQP